MCDLLDDNEQNSRCAMDGDRVGGEAIAERVVVGATPVNDATTIFGAG